METELVKQIMKLNCLSKKMTALLLGVSLLAGTYAVVLTVHASDQVSKAKTIGLVVDNRPLDHDVKIATSFAPIVKKVVPSVVKVEVTIPGKETEAESPLEIIPSSANSLAINSAADISDS